jgi:hypothetical protein
MDANEFDRINDMMDSSGFATIPLWLAAAIHQKNPRITLGLANSKLYRLNRLDKILNTVPDYSEIKLEVN